MQINELSKKALNFEFSRGRRVYLFENAPLTELMFVADELRKKQVPHGKVTWQIDRNVNTTNVCIANCKFCNFYRIPAIPKPISLICRPIAKKLKKPSDMAATNCYYRAAITLILDWIFM